MSILWDSLLAIGNVLLVGLILGAGLPALYAVGMRGVTMGRPITSDGACVGGRMTTAGRILAIICFGLVGVAVIAGIAILTFPQIWEQIFGR